MGTVPITIERMLDKIVSDAALVRKLGSYGTIRIKDSEGKVVEIGYTKTQAGYLNFSYASDSVDVELRQMRLRH